MESSPSQLLVVQGPGCGRCHGPHKHSLLIETIEDHTKRGWKPAGTRETRERKRCPTCARIFEVAQCAVPIVCHDQACPHCGNPHEVEYRTEQIDALGSEFSFQASLYCHNCDIRKGIAGVLDDLLKLKNVTVSLAGVCIGR